MTNHDDELEQQLKRYRPGAPSPALRARVLQTAGAPTRWQRLAVWWPAAAALAAIILLHLFTASTYADLRRPSEAAAREQRQAQIDSLSDAFGGGELGRAEAERVLNQLDASRAATPLPSPVEGASR